ncbi:MAG: hypothetical protein M0R75_07055 [Dehalococcoidia bacterium]|nr:hypothetical protein [Dehalococcoidia bacterium]
MGTNDDDMPFTIPERSKVDVLIARLQERSRERNFCLQETWGGRQGGKMSLQFWMQEEKGYVDHDKVGEVLRSLGGCKHRGQCRT